jgi:lipid-A-disaccharide synthase
MSIKPAKSYLISAGEFSGDLLAADLVHSLRDVLPDYVPFGVAGETMKLAGVQPLADIKDLSVMGILEVAKRINDIKMIESRLLAWVDRERPEFAILVDFPGFHFRLAEQLHLRGVKVYQYVAPKVWAWGKDRVKQLKDHFDGVFGVLPFEEEFFLQQGVPYFYVGSPHFDRVSKIKVSPETLGLPSKKPIFAFLPGSRRSEIQKILPIMMEIRRELLKICPEAVCVVPLASGLAWEDVLDELGESAAPAESPLAWEYAGFWWLRGGSIELMKVARSAVVASGTATLECALAGAPMVVIYAMNDLSYLIAKRAITVPWISLVNLLLNSKVVNEYIQSIDPKSVAQELFELSQDSPVRQQMLNEFERLTAGLEPGAAQKVANLITENIRRRDI